MSKATEWANAVKAAEKLEPKMWTHNQITVSATRSAGAVIHGQAMTAEDMRSLARWILDTFGEDSA